MRYVLDNIEAGQVPFEIRRHGIHTKQRVRVVVETLESDLPFCLLAEQGGAFKFLADEPDLYNESDIRS